MRFSTNEDSPRWLRDKLCADLQSLGSLSVTVSRGQAHELIAAVQAIGTLQLAEQAERIANALESLQRVCESLEKGITNAPGHISVSIKHERR